MQLSCCKSSTGKIRIAGAFFFLVLLSLAKNAGAQSPVSGTFTINSALPTDATNFQTFTEAVFSLGYGINGPVVFNVAPGSGPYVEQINVNFVPGASAVNTITFNCNGVTLENTSNNAQARAVFKFDGAQYFIIDSLTVHPIITNDPLSYGWGFGLLRNADNNIIRKCTVQIDAYTPQNPQNVIGIYVGSMDDFPDNNGVSDCDNNIIENNTITGGYDGIDMNNYAGNFGFDFTSMNSNQLINNKISGFVNSGIHIIWNNNTLVQGNDISGPLVNSGSSGIMIEEKNTGLKIDGNHIHNISTASGASVSSFRGINIGYCPATATTVNTISNNVIYDIRTTTDQQGIHIDNSSYFNIYHNTVSLNGTGAASGSVTAALDYEAVNMNVNFLNNILSVFRTGSGSRYGIYTTSVTTGFVCDYNDVITDPAIPFGRNVSTSYATLALWQAGTLRDAHSASADPLFTDLANGNLKPTNAAIDNLGKFAGITRDINTDVRNNNTPDIGAYEFLTPPCNTPVTPGVAIGVASVSSCGGAVRTLNLSGNTFGSGQTYQWQSSATLNGTYTDISGSLVSPPFDVYPATSTYYRAVVGCGPSSDVSVPVLINVRQPMAGNYTINATAPSGVTNFQSFAELLAAFNCGIAGPVVVDVIPGSGPYNEQVILYQLAGASATNTITIHGNGETLTNLSINTNERATLKLDGADYISIDNLNIIASASTTSQYGFGVQLLNDADHNTIRNCTITVNKTTTSANFSGIVINASASDQIGGTTSNCDFNTITGNTITGGYYGVVLSSDPTAAKITYDTISNNAIRDFHYYGIYVRGTDHALIEGNDLSRPTRTLSGSSPVGIYMNGVSTAAQVSKNRIHNTYGGYPTGSDAVAAISSNNCDAVSGSENIISNNLIYDFGSLGAQTGLSNTSSDYTLYYHNTINLDKTTGTPTTTARGFYQTTTATGIKFMDNIVTIKRSGTGVNTAIFLNTTASSIAAKNNDYIVAGTGTNYIGARSTSNYAALGTWQTASGIDANSLNVNPAYSNVATGDLTPTNLLIDNKGAAVGILTDITGAARSASLPDIGAYEFTGSTLPVKLLDIYATAAGSDAVVNWVTASEFNTHHFVLERSADATVFTPVTTIAAAGNSNANLQYGFTDKNAAAYNGVVYYRLNTVDIDGHAEYSKVVSVRFNGKENITVSVYPNPFVAEVFARITTATAGDAVIQVNDIAGRLISKQVQHIAAGTALIPVDKAATLDHGVYLLTVTLNGSTYVQKIVK